MRSWLNKTIELSLTVTLLVPASMLPVKDAGAEETPPEVNQQSCQDAKTNYSMLTHAVSEYQSQIQNMVGNEAKQLLKEDLAREVAEQKEGAGQGDGGAGAAMQGAVRCKYRAIGQPRCVYTDSWGKGGLLTVTLVSNPADAVCSDVEGSVALVKSQAYSAAESEQQFTSVSQQPFQFTVAPELSHMMSRETLSDLNKTETGGWNVRLRVRKPDGSYEERISEDRVTFMEVDPRYKEGPPGTFTANCGGYSPEDLLDVAVQCTYRDQCRGDALAERELGMVTAAGTFTVKVPNPDRECVYGFYETRFVGGAGHSIHSATSGRNALTGTISASAVSKGKTCPECRFAAHCNILPATARGSGAWVELETGQGYRSCPKYCPMQCPKYLQLARCPDYCQTYCPAYPQLTMCSGYCQAYCPKYEPVSMCPQYCKQYKLIECLTNEHCPTGKCCDAGQCKPIRCAAVLSKSRGFDPLYQNQSTAPNRLPLMSLRGFNVNSEGIELNVRNICAMRAAKEKLEGETNKCGVYLSVNCECSNCAAGWRGLVECPCDT